MLATPKPQIIWLLVLLLSFLVPVGAALAVYQGASGKANENTNANSNKQQNNKGKRGSTRQTNSANASRDEITFWESIKDSNDPDDFKAYLEQYPHGRFVTLARNRLKKLESAPPKVIATPVPSPTPRNSGIGNPELSTQATVVRNQIGMELVWIPRGSYLMGSNTGMPDQKPAHQVTISNPFLIGKYEVTQAQWRAVVGRGLREQRDRSDHDWSILGEGDNYPMYYVSWSEAQEFIQKLNQMNDGYTYRLPTEAEWEYACRAGSAANDSDGLATVAWFGNNSGKHYIDAAQLWRGGKNNYGQQIIGNGNQSHPVGTKRPNAFGLYDMLGNVYEWCEDWYHDDYTGAPTDGSAWLTGGAQNDRVLRGGSWYLYDAFARPAARMFYPPELRRNHYGFRVVATPRPGALTDSSNNTQPPKLPTRTVAHNQMGMALVLISPGSFMMGSNGPDDQKPVHQVTIRNSFYMGQYEVTQAQWQVVMGTNPSLFKDCPNCPVEQVSWYDVQQFIQRLNQMNDGYTYRLPTEAEWEYACRAGTTGDYAGNLEELAWYSGNSGEKTHPVGTKQTNAWGLADMHGNVWEWCEDWYHDSYNGAPTDGSAWLSAEDQTWRVVRGGSWHGNTFLRSAARGHVTLNARISYGGFRVVAIRRT